MSFESASNKDQSRWDADKHSMRSSFMQDWDDAAFSGLFQQAFGPVQTSSPDIHSEQEFPLDDFEAGVMTSCMLSSVEQVAVPVDFEDQVMARIQAEKAPVADTPRSFRSPLLRHTSRELYRRYRRVVHVVFPLAAAASIVVAMYVQDNSNFVKGFLTWPPFSTPVETSVEPPVPQQPSLEMQVPTEEQVAQPKQTTGKTTAGKAPAKKKVKSVKPAPITGE